MRKYQQKKLLELTQTLNEANAEIERLFLRGDFSAVLQLLADCQTVTVQMGEFIESIEGEGTNTVSLLEEYHEDLYSVSVGIDENSAGTGDIKRLCKVLISIENSIKSELKPNKIEIVFLPYKASMWDSLESIWLAAKDDPQCDAYVVPIPYYDKLPGGAFGEMHYEGDLYPDYVPVTDWREYDIEARHPDAVFMHNPYDEGNYVTSVHHNFYSKRLKSFTDRLVYVPYFVLSDDVPEHFCVCAGTLHADRVILQSEKIRETYIRIFKAFENSNNCKDKFGKAEDKFVALGSPKYDKAINANREDYVLPDEWRSLIEKPDGTGKKSVLYNTAVGAILYYNEKYLTKLVAALEYFRSRDDVVLWWRPHPLSAATFESLRPQLATEYEKIVAEYRRDGWGIYDDTADLYRAIALTDAYYGDQSSLISMYLCTGKPVMQQNVFLREYGGVLDDLRTGDAHDDGENIWFTSLSYNALFKMDKRTWKAEYMGSFPNEVLNKVGLFRGIAGNEGKLYFAPNAAKEMAEYDITSGAFKKIEIDFSVVNGYAKSPNGLGLLSAVSYKQFVFLLPFTCSAIIRHNTKTGETALFYDWVESIKRYSSGKVTIGPVCVNGCEIVMPSCEGNAVVVFNMDTCVSEVFEVGGKGNCYAGVCYDGCDYWLAPRRGDAIVKWNRDSRKWKEVNSFPKGFVPDENWSFWSACYCNGHVWLLPYFANMAIKVSVKDEIVSVAEEFQELCEAEPVFSWVNFTFSTVIDDAIYALAGKNNKFVSYNPKTGEKKTEGVALPDEAKPLYKEIAEMNMQKDIPTCTTAAACVFYESPQLPLRLYLRRLTESEYIDNANALRDKQIEILTSANAATGESSGAAIYKRCKGELCI